MGATIYALRAIVPAPCAYRRGDGHTSLESDAPHPGMVPYNDVAKFDWFTAHSPPTPIAVLLRVEIELVLLVGAQVIAE
jgi:hypothetical protein